MSEQKFYATLIGSTLVITAEPISVPTLRQLSGRTYCEPGVERQFIDWLSNASVNEAAEVLGVSRGKVSHLRRSLGLSETYTGESRTTIWRKSK